MKHTAFLIAVILILSVLSAPFAYAAESGICGDTVTWTYDRTSGTLYISGTGKMKDYAYPNTPWNALSQSITKISVSDGVTYIGKNSFRNFYNLKEAKLPDTLTAIGESAFASCFALELYSLPENITSIDANAFYLCEKITLTRLPEKVTEIKEGTFFGCASLNSFVVCEGVTSIGKNAFYYCSNLTDIRLPTTLKTVLQNAFSDCDNLETVYYVGSDNAWKSITLESGNDSIKKATRLDLEFELGDVDQSGNKDASDAIYLLYHVYFPNSYKVYGNCDFDKSGGVDSADAIYLLYHIYFPSDYKL